jgi:hypothetical protein
MCVHFQRSVDTHLCIGVRIPHARQAKRKIRRQRTSVASSHET